MITFEQLQSLNEERAKRWHQSKEGVKEWSALEWAGAMCGEAGEAANAAKKLKRVEQQIANLDKREASPAVAEQIAENYRQMIAEEAADTIIYGLLLMSMVGKDATTVIRAVFNQKSEEYGFPEKL